MKRGCKGRLLLLQVAVMSILVGYLATLGFLAPKSPEFDLDYHGIPFAIGAFYLGVKAAFGHTLHYSITGDYLIEDCPKNWPLWGALMSFPYGLTILLSWLPSVAFMTVAVFEQSVTALTWFTIVSCILHGITVTFFTGVIIVLLAGWDRHTSDKGLMRVTDIGDAMIGLAVCLICLLPSILIQKISSVFRRRQFVR